MAKTMTLITDDNFADLSLDVFKDVTLPLSAEIQSLAEGLSKEEVCEYFGITYEELKGDDKRFFDANHARGRVAAKRTAVRRLFDSMKKNNGHQAALSYLVRFSESWEENVASGVGTRTYKFEITGG